MDKITNLISGTIAFLASGWAWASTHFEFLIPTAISILVLIVSIYYNQKRHGMEKARRREQREKHDLEIQLLKININK